MLRMAYAAPWDASEGRAMLSITTIIGENTCCLCEVIGGADDRLTTSFASPVTVGNTTSINAAGGGNLSCSVCQ